MGKKYIKEDKDGKEHLYEEGFFGERDLGELKERDLSPGVKETRPEIFDPGSWFQEQSEVERKGSHNHSDYRGPGKVEGQEGRFEKKFWDRYPTFYPNGSKKISDSGSSNYSSSDSGGGGGLGCLPVLLIGGAIALIMDFGGIKEELRKFLYPSIKSVEISLPRSNINLDEPFPPRFISIEKIVGDYRYAYKPLSGKRERQIFETADLDNNKILEKDERSELVRRIKDAVIQDRRKNVNPRKVRKMVLDSYSSNPQISEQHEDVEKQNHQKKNNQQEKQKNYDLQKHKQNNKGVQRKQNNLEEIAKIEPIMTNNPKLKKENLEDEKITEKYFFFIGINSEGNFSIEYSEKSEGFGGLYDSRNSSKIVIDKDKYPGFYEKMNLKEQQLISCDRTLNSFSEFANKYSVEVSVKSIVDDFVSEHSK